MGAGIHIRLRLSGSLSYRSRLRFFLLRIIMDVYGGFLIHFSGVGFRSLAGIKFQGLSVLLAPAFRMAEDGSAAAHRPYAVSCFIFHSDPPYRSCCLPGFACPDGSFGFVSFKCCRTEGFRSASGWESVMLTYSPMIQRASP